MLQIKEYNTKNDFLCCFVLTRSHHTPEVNKPFHSITGMDDERYESDEPFTDSLVDSIFGDGIAVAVERCPLCLRSRRPFYCKDCVNAGNFSRNSNKSERYYITFFVDSSVTSIV